MFRTKLKFLLPTVIVVMLSLFLSHAMAAEKRQTATIKSIENGNTLITDTGDRLRLIDIELSDEEIVLTALVEFLENRVEGKEVQLEKDSVKQDWDGAHLVYLFVDNRLLNAEILNKGFAKMKSRTRNTRYQTSLFRSQASAYSDKRGIWGDLDSENPEESAKGATAPVKTKATFQPAKAAEPLGQGLGEALTGTMGEMLKELGKAFGMGNIPTPAKESSK